MTILGRRFDGAAAFGKRMQHLCLQGVDAGGIAPLDGDSSR
jgi:hypothetical protein